MTDHRSETRPQPENYDGPFEYALALGSSSEAMQVVWDRWTAAAEECQRHQVGQTYDVGHEHGTLTAIKKMHQILGDILARADEVGSKDPDGR